MKGIERILSIIDISNLVEVLSSEKLNWADFHTLLLNIFEKKIRGINAADIMQNYKENRFTSIADVDPRELLEIDRVLYSVLPGQFTAVELAPVNPIGVNAALTMLDPKVVLSTIRNMEVVGDQSMALAIECAYRRRVVRTTKESLEVNLATTHRVLRLQNFSKDSGLSSHFRAFALASAARDTVGFNRFELNSLATHLEVWLNFLAHSLERGYRAEKLSVGISDIRIANKLVSEGRITQEEIIHRAKDKTFSLLRTCSIDLPDHIENARDISITQPELETYIRELQFTEREIVERLREKYPSVRFYFDLARCTGTGYYTGLCYRLSAQNLKGVRYSLAGGGSCDWTRKLLNSKREHLITGGFGTEMFLKLFKDVQY